MDSKQRTELSLIEILRIKITNGKFRGLKWQNVKFRGRILYFDLKNKKKEKRKKKKEKRKERVPPNKLVPW